MGLPAKRTLAAIADRLGSCWAMPDLSGRVRVGYNGRLRTTLGRAVLAEHRVELNPRLLREHPGQLLPTLAHELAHVAVHLRHGEAAPHGVQWRVLMVSAGFLPTVCHNLPVEPLRRRRRRFRYLHRCSDCGYHFVARRVRRDVYCIACGPEMAWDVFRVPDTPAGRKLLEKLLAGV
jgi:SprT-like protein